MSVFAHWYYYYTAELWRSNVDHMQSKRRIDSSVCIFGMRLVYIYYVSTDVSVCCKHSSVTQDQ